MKKYRKFIIAILILLIPTIAVGYKYFSSQKTRDIENRTLIVEGDFTEATITGKQDLVPGDEICGAIGIETNCTTPSLLRVKVEALSKAYGSTDTATDAIEAVDISIGNNWEYSDGYYYYTSEVNGENQIAFLNSITFGGADTVDINNYQDKQLDIKLTMELVQAKYDAYKQAWGLTSLPSTLNQP